MIRAILHIGFVNGTSAICVQYRLFYGNGLIFVSNSDGHPTLDVSDITKNADPGSWKAALKAAFIAHITNLINGETLPPEARVSIHDKILMTDFAVV